VQRKDNTAGAENGKFTILANSGFPLPQKKIVTDAR